MNFSLFYNPRFRWSLWSLYVVVWTILLLIPIPQKGPLALEEISITRKYLIAKTLHVIAYALMTALSGWLPVSIRFRWILLFFVMVHASVTEMLQIPVDRGGSLYDVGYDHFGVFLGLLVTWKWWSKMDDEIMQSRDR